MLASGLRHSNRETMRALCCAATQWSDVSQPWYQKHNWNLFSLNMEGLYFHLPQIGVQAIIHTMPNEIQRIVFIDDPWILMKKHAQRDILLKVIRAVPVVSSPPPPPPPPSLCTPRLYVCLRVELLAQSVCVAVWVCVCVEGLVGWGGVLLKYD